MAISSWSTTTTKRREPSPGRLFQYGWQGGTWIAGDLFRIGAALSKPGDFKENLEEARLKREQALQAKFSDIDPEEAETEGWARAGEIISSFVDPALFATMYLAAPVKGIRGVATASKLAQRGKAASWWAGYMGAGEAIRGTAEGREVTPKDIGIASLIGGGIGAAFPGHARWPWGASRRIPKPDPMPTPTGSRFRGTTTPPKVGRPQPKPKDTRSIREKLRDRQPVKGRWPKRRPIPQPGERTKLKFKRKNPTGNVLPWNKPLSEFDPPLAQEVEKALHLSFMKAREALPQSVFNVLSNTTNHAQEINLANKFIKRYKDAVAEAARKGPTGYYAYTDPTRLAEFKTASEAGQKFLNSMSKYFPEQVEAMSDGVVGLVKGLEKDGLLTAATLRRAMIRPVIGAAGGYATGVTANIFRDEDDFSPLMFALIGASIGAASVKINASKFSPSIKQAATDTSHEMVRRSLWAHANVLFSGTMGSKGNAFGGEVELFSKSLLNQLGADAQGAIRTSTETTKDLVIQEWNLIRHEYLSNVGLLGFKPTQIRLREEIGRYINKFTDDAMLDDYVAKNIYTAKESVIIKDTAKHIAGLWESLTREVEAIIPDFKRLPIDQWYGMPQMHNYKKIRKNVSVARTTYEDAFIEQSKMKYGLQSIDDLTSSQIKKAKEKANNMINEIVKTGSSTKKIKSSWNISGEEGVALYGTADLPLRNLLNHFERDRKLTYTSARKIIEDFLVLDVDEVFTLAGNTTIPTLMFARNYGARGERIQMLKQDLKGRFIRSKEAAANSPSEVRALEKLEKQHYKFIHDSVDAYFGRLHASHSWADADLASNVFAVLTTLANLTYLPKVTISSLGDLIQPLQNSGIYSAMRGYGRSMSRNEKTNFAKLTGFEANDVMGHELQAYTINNRPGSTVQAAMYWTNQKWFKLIGLARLTSFARKFAYNTGVEEGFKVSRKVGMAKKVSDSLRHRANSMGLEDDIVKHLNKFDTVDEAFADKVGRRYLNTIGVKHADRDALIPQIGNRLGFAQSQNPAIRAMGQFTSWAQAKTTQTNELISRMESGDAALAVRMLGTLVLYDGVLTFRDFLNDPTGKRLQEPGGPRTYAEQFRTLEQAARAYQFSGNWGHWLIDRGATLMSTNNANNPVSNIAPSLGFAWDMLTGFSPIPIGKQYGTVWTNLARDDPEGAFSEFLERIPLGSELKDFYAAIGHDIENKPSPYIAQRGRPQIPNIVRRGEIKAKGGVVENVPRVPKEPDERIDKMTGLPYNIQAGIAFIDEEDPLKRLGLGKGGFIDPSTNEPLERLGFVFGGLGPALAKAASSLFTRKTLPNIGRLTRQFSNMKASVTDRIPTITFGEQSSAAKELTKKISSPFIEDLPQNISTSATMDVSVSKTKVPSPASIKIDIDRFARDEEGFVSPTIQALIEKAPPKLKGKQIVEWARKNTKQKELEFLGLDEFVSANPNATLRETIEGISGSKVRISKNIRSGESGDYLRYEQTTAKIDPLDGSNLWEPQATEIRYSLEQGDAAIKKDLVNFYNLNARLAASSSEGPGVRWARAFNPPRWGQVADVDKIPKSIIDDVIEDFAESQYMDNPYTIIKPWGAPYRGTDSREALSRPDIFAMGNDDVGYQIFTDGKRVTDLDNIAYSTTEAEIQLRNALYETGVVVDESYAAIYKQYVDESLPGGSNYREVVFNWRNAPETHAYGSHFDDDTQIAHALIRDRKIKDGPKSLHVDELQSDFHTAGSKEGYKSLPRQQEEVFKKIRDYLKDKEDYKFELKDTTKIDFETTRAVNTPGVSYPLPQFHQPAYYRYTSEPQGPKRNFLDFRNIKRYADMVKQAAGRPEEKARHDQIITELADIIKPIALEGPVPRYPYPDDYHKRVIKELLLQAIEDGKTALSFSSSHAIKSRYIDRYATFYEMLYDKKIPSFMKKLANEYGGKFEKGRLDWADTYGPGLRSGGGIDDTKINILRITPEMKEKILKEGLQSFAVGGIVASQHDSGRGLLATTGTTKESEDLNRIGYKEGGLAGKARTFFKKKPVRTFFENRRYEKVKEGFLKDRPKTEALWAVSGPSGESWSMQESPKEGELASFMHVQKGATPNEWEERADLLTKQFLARPLKNKTTFNDLSVPAKLDAIVPERRTISPDELNLFNQYTPSEAYKEIFNSSAVRLYARSVKNSLLGRKQQIITEKDFSPEELEAIVRALANASKKGHPTIIRYKDYEDKPLLPARYRWQLNPSLFPSASMSEELDRFLGNPGRSVKFTLGQASVNNGVITDQYNFGAGPDTSFLDFIKALPLAIQSRNTRAPLNFIGNLAGLREGEGPEIRIDLNNLPSYQKLKDVQREQEILDALKSPYIEQDAGRRKFRQGGLVLLNQLRENVFERLGVKVQDKEQAGKALDSFNKYIVMAESTNRYDAKNPNSTASGGYQFTNEGAKTAANRVLNTLARMAGMYNKNNQGAERQEYMKSGNAPLWLQDVSSGKTRAFEVTPIQQQIMFEGDMFERKGSDLVVQPLLTGDRNAMDDYYYNFHHTNPQGQPNTKQNWERAIKHIDFVLKISQVGP